MQDQLVIFQALAEGRATVDSGRERYASLHTKTARWVAEKVLGIAFEDDGVCQGMGFEVGEMSSEKMNSVGDEGLNLEQLRLGSR